MGRVHTQPQTFLPTDLSPAKPRAGMAPLCPTQPRPKVDPGRRRNPMTRSPKIIIPFASALAVTQEFFRLLYLVLIMTSLASPASFPSQKLSISDSFACPVLNLARLFYFGSRVRDIVIGFARFYRYPFIAMGAPI